MIQLDSYWQNLYTKDEIILKIFLFRLSDVGLALNQLLPEIPNDMGSNPCKTEISEVV